MADLYIWYYIWVNLSIELEKNSTGKQKSDSFEKKFMQL